MFHYVVHHLHLKAIAKLIIKNPACTYCLLMRRFQRIMNKDYMRVSPIFDFVIILIKNEFLINGNVYCFDEMSIAQVLGLWLCAHCALLHTNRHRSGRSIIAESMKFKGGKSWRRVIVLLRKAVSTLR